MELTAALESLIAQEGVSLFGIADTAGFQHALPDWHPRRLVPMAKRALVFGRPFVGPKLVVDDKTNLSNESYWKANQPVLGEISRLRSKIVDLLDSFGFAACNFGGFRIRLRSYFFLSTSTIRSGPGCVRTFRGVHKPCFRLLLYGWRPPDRRRPSCDRKDRTRGISALQPMQLVCRCLPAESDRSKQGAGNWLRQG
jgi:hypothetical protein